MRAEEYNERQENMRKAGVAKVIVKVLSICKNKKVCHGALDLGAEALAGGNRKMQHDFKKLLDGGDKEGTFFLSMRR